MKVFLDTNVLLDVLARREPFLAEAAALWTLAETGEVTAFASVLSLPNIFYVLSRTKGQGAADKALVLLRDIFTLVPLDAQIVNQAIDAGIKDFEDAIQYFSALRVHADALITRNTKDFPRRNLAIQTPMEFLTAHFPE